jgi:hypothetical protein
MVKKKSTLRAVDVVIAILVAILIAYCIATANASESPYEQAKERMDQLLRRIDQESPPASMTKVEWSEEQPPVLAYTDTGNRAYMITAAWCGPCRLSKKNCGSLIGSAGSGAPVEMIDVDARPRYAAEMNIRHAAVIPAWVIVRDDGKEIARTVGSQSEYSLRAMLLKYDVTAEQQIVPGEAITIATISSGPTTKAVVAAFTQHLAGMGDNGEFPVGGLFDRDVSVPDDVPRILSLLMAGEPVEIPDAGLSITWNGPRRRLEFASSDQLTINPPMVVQLQKWKMSVTTTLSGVEISDEGREIRFLLKGPDFTVRFTP